MAQLGTDFLSSLGLTDDDLEDAVARVSPGPTQALQVIAPIPANGTPAVDYNPRGGTVPQLKADQRTDTNLGMDVARQRADLASGAFAKKADLMGEAGRYATQKNDAADVYEASRKESTATFDKGVDEQVKRMTDRARAGIQNNRQGLERFGMAMAVLGGLTGNGAMVGLGNFVNNKIAQDAHKTLVEQGLDQDALEANIAGGRYNSAQVAGHFEAAGKAVANKHAEMAIYAEEEANRATSEDKKLEFQQMAIEQRQRARDALIKTQVEASAAKNRSVNETKAYLAVANAFTDDERIAAAAAFGDDGSKALKSYYDVQGKLAEIRNKDADTAHKSGGTGKLTEAQQKMDVVVAGAKDSIERLAPYQSGKKELPYYGVVRGDWMPDVTVPEENLQYRHDVKNLLNAVIRGETGAGMNDKELDKKADGLGLWSSDPTIRKSALDSLMGQVKAMDVTGRLGGTAPAQGSPLDVQVGAKGQAQPTVDPNAPVPMIDDKGARRLVDPRLVEAARQRRGWTPASEVGAQFVSREEFYGKKPVPPAPQPAPPPRAFTVDPMASDADYMAQVLKDSGY